MLNRGFTLIEVLVTLVILMFGLLGIAGLIMKGQRASYEAYQRQQALSIASDLVERIKSNQRQITTYIPAGDLPMRTIDGDGSIFSSVGGGVTDCDAATCTPAEIAAYDIAIWDGQLNGTAETIGGVVAGGIINARGCIEVPAGAIANTYRISVSWQGNDETAAPTTTDCGEGLYGTEGRRRVVSLDVTLEL
jgi:type IV pilus assembly protein PilV